jgi:hypothetical protein
MIKLHEDTPFNRARQRRQLDLSSRLLTPTQAKKLAIELLARAMAPDIVRLAKANYRSIGKHRKLMGASPLELKTAAEATVEAAMDAYEPHRILLDEIGDKTIARLFKLAELETLTWAKRRRG